MRIAPDVREVLERVTIDGTDVVLAGQLDRKLYTKTNAVLEALGGRWNRSKKAHVFAVDAAGLVEAALVRGEVATKKEDGFFPTPMPLVLRMVEFVVTSPGMKVLEPSAGDGRMAQAARSRGAAVSVVEWSSERRAALHGVEVGLSVFTACDFMEIPMRAGDYDGIVANPPFCRVGRGDHIDHLNKMLDLAPARLACVMPRSIEFRTDRRHTVLRERLSGLGATIESLPEGTFRESGTDVRTSLVLLTSEVVS